MKVVSLICAASGNGVIGNKSKLPWHLPADLKRFKQLTMGRPILMGRKTFESIGKLLPGRTNIIVSRQKDLKICGGLTAGSMEEALRLTQDAEEVFVIGGAEIFKQALLFADKIYLTLIHHDFEGDTRMFDIDSSAWQETSREDFQPDGDNKYPYSFLIYERKNGPNAV